jgi:hypothetical protein
MKANKSIFTRKTAISGFNTKKNYSSFWMDDDSDITSRYGGLSSEVRSSSDLFKVIKLNNYRRAVTNFVKIVTNMDIPVTWFSGGSYTDSKSINLTSDIKDNNFDVTVGLALHEASHIKLTDFSVLQDMYEGKIDSVNTCKGTFSLIKEMLNWIEDRRIDHYIFSTSPGYKAYYHKLYDYYWNDKNVNKGFKSTQFNDPTSIQSYEFHIINMLNPLFDSKALPGLEEITKLIDVRNISRLKNTREALEIAVEVVNIIMANVEQNTPQQSSSQEQGDQESDSSEESQEQGEGEGQGGSGEGAEQKDGAGSSSEGTGEGETQEPQNTELTDKEMREVQKALDKMRDFLNGKTDKKRTTKGLQKQLDSTANENMQIQAVGGSDGVKSMSSIMMDGITGSLSQLIANSEVLKELRDERYKLPYDEHSRRAELNKEIERLSEAVETHAMNRYFQPNTYASKETREAVQKGLEMGALLGKKLQLHNESREKIDNRLRSGKIDNRRLAHAGYGIESVFQQITIDKYKKANLHISLDGSGSMNGRCWNSAAQMTAAIGKAISYTQNIELQVSIRATDAAGNGDVPVVISIYDSRKNNLNHLVKALTCYHCGSNTPEGLCFEAMYKQHQILSGTSDMDSYFLNISDGMPGMGNYSGYEAVRHTAKWVNKIKTDLNVKVLSFFLDGSYGSEDMAQMIKRFNGTYGAGNSFRQMYGKDAAAVNPSSVLDIARELNKKFMSK